jgi:uncharacterized protein
MTTTSWTPPSLAIIGSGIAGMACAYFLRHHYRLSLFEKQSRLGGHTHTVTVREPSGKSVSIDTGFMVFNPITYPNVCRFFRDLGIEGQRSDMSFSCQSLPDGIEWAGAGFSALFGQRRNLINPRFWQFLMTLNRFNQQATRMAETGTSPEISLKEYLQSLCETDQQATDFQNWYLLPMGSAIWSTSPERMLGFPLRTLVQFYHNHGFLGMNTHYQWWTVPQGSKSYMEKLYQLPELKGVAQSGDAIVGDAVVKVQPHPAQAARVQLHFESGRVEAFDKVIIATHADEALALLAQPTPQQQKLLSAFPYESNVATLHSDARVMPKRKSVWSAWNYRYRQDAATGQGSVAATHYWMNRLQQLETDRFYAVSINDEGSIDPALIHWQGTYTHPRFTPEGIAAQAELPTLNDAGSVYFTGSYFRYGFHEDAFQASLALCRRLLEPAGVRSPWEVATAREGERLP